MTEYQRYAVMLDNFGHDSSGNPTAFHTVFGYRESGANIKYPNAELFATKRRQQVGTTERRDLWARTALEKAGAPAGIPLARVEGNRSNGEIFLIYDVAATAYKPETLRAIAQQACIALRHIDKVSFISSGNPIYDSLRRKILDTIDQCGYTVEGDPWKIVKNEPVERIE